MIGRQSRSPIGYLFYTEHLIRNNIISIIFSNGIFGDISEDDRIVVSTLNTGYEGMELTPMVLDMREEF